MQARLNKIRARRRAGLQQARLRECNSAGRVANFRHECFAL